MINDRTLCHYLSGDVVDLDVVALQIRNGASANTVNLQGDSVLHIAVFSQNIDHIRAAITMGVDVQITNRAGQSALYCLLNQSPCNLEAAFLLIKSGASANISNQYGDNLLHLAIYSENLRHIRSALSLGVNRHNMNQLGQVPLLSLLKQNPVNLEATALFLLVDSLTRSTTQRGSPLALLTLQEPGHCLKRDGLERLAKIPGNKERVIQYIQSLSPGMQRGLINQCRDERTTLGTFFFTPRGLFPTSLTSGSLATLLDMKRRLPVNIKTVAPVIHPWSPDAVSSGYLSSAVPSAPPAVDDDRLPTKPCHPFTQAPMFFSESNAFPGHDKLNHGASRMFYTK